MSRNRFTYRTMITIKYRLIESLPEDYGRYIFVFRNGLTQTGYYNHKAGDLNESISVLTDTEEVATYSPKDVAGYLQIIEESSGE